MFENSFSNKKGKRKMPNVLTVAILLIGIAIAFLYAVAPSSLGAWRILLIKMSASTCFVLLGGLHAFWNETLYGYTVFVGLIFGFAADFVFGARTIFKKNKVFFFCAGASIFAAGHIIYTLAFHMVEKIFFGWYIVAIIIAYLMYSLPQKKDNAHYSKLSSIILSYTLTISFSLCCALAVFFANPFSFGGIFIAIGVILFCISDYLLIYITFLKRRKKAVVFIHTMTYFCAQLLYAMSIKHFL